MKKKAKSRPTSPSSTTPLASQTALITGGNRGLGLAFAKALAAQGCAVIITGRNERRLSSVAKELATFGVEVLTHHCDVRDERSVTALFKTVREQFGHIDILINNAGIAHASKPLAELSTKDWRDNLDTNLTGTFFVTRAALPLMSPGATIVNNLSITVKSAFPSMGGYNASKYGALGYTNTLRLELQPRGIRVLALIAGAADTDIWKQFWPTAPRKKMMTADSIAQLLIAALTLPANTSVHELIIAPTAGAL